MLDLAERRSWPLSADVASGRMGFARAGVSFPGAALNEATGLDSLLDTGATQLYKLSIGFWRKARG